MRLSHATALLALLPLFAQPNPDWTAPQKPFHIAGNLYYVGSRDLAAYLVTTPAGNILINSNLESSPPQIRASVETSGFRWNEIRILLNSQAHYDHAAGSAAILKQTDAKMMVMEGDAQSIEDGGRLDFGGHRCLRSRPRTSAAFCMTATRCSWAARCLRRIRRRDIRAVAQLGRCR